ncbi:MAG: lipocalin family protein [Thermodesulforhabdaceae bacterium]
MEKSSPDSKNLETVGYVDLSNYVGLWYEIAKIPNKFQRKCDKNTTAFYSLNQNGDIVVVNSCVTSSGERIEVKGLARVVDKNTNAKLKVSFFNFLGINLFWGDYWIIGLSHDYNWAVVGTPGRKYGWILSRHPSLDEQTLGKVKNLLREKGYNPEDFQMTSQLWP